eukprot:851477-Rhodomonas_salina.1
MRSTTASSTSPPGCSRRGTAIGAPTATRSGAGCGTGVPQRPHSTGKQTLRFFWPGEEKGGEGRRREEKGGEGRRREEKRGEGGREQRVRHRADTAWWAEAGACEGGAWKLWRRERRREGDGAGEGGRRWTRLREGRKEGGEGEEREGGEGPVSDVDGTMECGEEETTAGEQDGGRER